MTESADLILVDTPAPGVERWRLNSPPVNALDPGLLGALEARLDALEGDRRVAVLVLGSALRLFSAGADARWMAQRLAAVGVDALIDEFNALMDRFRRICTRLHTGDRLVIASLQGHALAGGLELAAACDLRFAADQPRAQLGVPEMKLFGELPSGGGGTVFLGRILGPAAALQLILEGESISPRRAFEIGLVDRLDDPDAHEGAVLDLAGRVAAQAGIDGTAAAKAVLFGTRDLPFEAAIARDREIHWRAMRGGAFARGVIAFAEKFGGPAG
jgi:enoyl-CoA hydratase/carnithine racemase